METYTIINVLIIAALESKWTATFKATGCHSPNLDPKVWNPSNPPMNYWVGIPDQKVFDAMMEHCRKVRDEVSDGKLKKRKILCCGKIDCTVSLCVHQNKWTFGKKHSFP